MRGRPKGSKNRVPAAPKISKPKAASGLPDIGSTYGDAWLAFRHTKEYDHSAEALTNRTYTPTQPYVDHVIERIFMEGYHSHRQQTRDNGKDRKTKGNQE